MKKKGIRIIVALLLFIIAITIKFNNVLINNVIYIISYFIVGIEIVKKALRNIFRGKIFDENFLMSVATVGAFIIGEFSEAVAVMLFYQVGELFQNYAVDKSRKTITSLINIRPDFANVERNGKVKKVNPDEVEIGEIIIIKPGEKVPLDGYVIEGSTSIDTKTLTGETLPKEIKKSDEVLSGSINLSGVIKVKVAKKYEESTVSKIIDLVENASSKKSESEKFITRFARYYTPVVVIIAVILAIFPPLIIKNATFSTWIYKALSFLVVSCPCALVISIPLSFFGGIARASKMGVLIKGSNYLEAIANLEILVFDKTGTLTEGVFYVQKIKSVDISEDELLKIVAYCENYSNHPISLSIKKAYNKEIDTRQINKIEELAGLGINAKIGNKNVLVGNENLMIKKKIKFIKCSEAGTILHVAIDEKYAGYILIADKIKDEAADVIKKLKKNNVKKIIMLTGDGKNVGKAVAKKLELDEDYEELLPADKVLKVSELLNKKSKKGKLAFVGDGINDAPVLAMSDIGISMGKMGSDVAIEASDIVIMTDEISKIVGLIKLSKKTMNIVKQNIVFAILIKSLVLILSAFGFFNMWEAVLADVGVLILDILNALRIFRIKVGKN